MTDCFYKKIYGYDDDIQLQDDDIVTLENGMHLRKMNDKEDFNKRFYKLDLYNNQLVASTKEFRKKEKQYPLIGLNEVKIGCSSDNLKSYKLKKLGELRRKDEPDLENLAFCVTYDNFRKTIDLLAPNETEQHRWVRVLSYFIVLTKKRKGVLPETDNIMRNYFELADTSKNNSINESEISKFLDSMNIKVKKDKLIKLMEKADINKDGVLEEHEFEKFIYRLYHREDLLSIFKAFGTDFMSLEKLKIFLNDFQMENVSEQNCLALIDKYEMDDDHKEKSQLSFSGFVNYLMDLEQYIEENQTKVTHDMKQPIFSYFVNSSHNTYLSGDQLTSKSSADCYRAAIMNGARLVEMDVYDGSDDKPIIYHQKTLTSKILFEEAIQTCKEYAFKLSDYPLIITIELHCSPDQQKIMADIIKRNIFDYLYVYTYNPDEAFPTLEQLKGKILLRCKNPPKSHIDQIATIIQTIQPIRSSSLDFENESSEEEDENEDYEQIQELSDLLNVMQNVSFKGVDFNFENYKKNQTCSLSEAGGSKLIDNETAENILRLTQNYLIKIYPAFFRTDSSNLSSLDYWIYGFQIVALNFQKNDETIQLNRALFNDNANSGYVLKPSILLDNSLNFDPTDLNTMKNKQILEIKIISGQQFPETKDLVKDISDPYVIISTYGVKADENEEKTSTIKNNGFNPIWNEKFEFVINCPELAFVKFTIKDKDIGKDQLLGDYTVRYQNIKQGYRHIKLLNKESQGTLFVAIRVKPFQSFSDLLSKV